MNYNTRARAEASPPLEHDRWEVEPPTSAFRGGEGTETPRERGGEPLFERFEPFLRSGFLNARNAQATRNFALRNWSRDRGCLNQLYDYSEHRRARDQLLYSSAPGALQPTAEESYCIGGCRPIRSVGVRVFHITSHNVLTYADRAGARSISRAAPATLSIQQTLHEPK